MWKEVGFFYSAHCTHCSVMRSAEMVAIAAHSHYQRDCQTSPMIKTERGDYCGHFLGHFICIILNFSYSSAQSFRVFRWKLNPMKTCMQRKIVIFSIGYIRVQLHLWMQHGFTEIENCFNTRYKQTCPHTHTQNKTRKMSNTSANLPHCVYWQAQPWYTACRPGGANALGSSVFVLLIWLAGLIGIKCDLPSGSSIIWKSFPCHHKHLQYCGLRKNCTTEETEAVAERGVKDEAREDCEKMLIHAVLFHPLSISES